jgi:hypothetical protein
VTIDEVWIGNWICWHYSELQVITALSLFCTIYKPLGHGKSSQYSLVISWQRIHSRALATLSSQLNCQPSANWIRIRVTVTLRPAVYRQSVRLGDKPLETHDQHFFQLNTCFHSPLSESELLYVWRFTANQFILAPHPLRLTTRIFSQLNTCGHSPYITSSLTRG